jgi:hypothetical protein
MHLKHSIAYSDVETLYNMSVPSKCLLSRRVLISVTTSHESMTAKPLRVSGYSVPHSQR